MPAPFLLEQRLQDISNVANRQAYCRGAFRSLRKPHFVHQTRRREKQWVLYAEGSTENLEASVQAGLDDLSERDKRQGKEAKKYKEHNEQIKELAKKVDEGLGGTSIYLVGMMGSGKSTVGKLLAAALSYPYLDADQLTEQHADMSISEIFASEGEESFRELETAVLKELMQYKSVVVSTGGGAVLKRLNWGYMQHGIVVWLEGSPEILAQRAIKDDNSQRPLLRTYSENGVASEEDRYEQTRTKLASILDERQDKYAQADIRISLAEPNDKGAGASASLVTFRVLKAINDRIEGDRKKEPVREKQFKGFGKPPKPK